MGGGATHVKQRPSVENGSSLRCAAGQSPVAACRTKRTGIANPVAAKSRQVRGPPSGGPVAAVVARGEAEIGFQQVSELIHVPGVLFVGPIPAELQEETFFWPSLLLQPRIGKQPKR